MKRELPVIHTKELELRLNIWARVVLSLDRLQKKCEKFNKEDGRYKENSFDPFWILLVSVRQHFWFNRSLKDLGYPVVCEILNEHFEDVCSRNYSFDQMPYAYISVSDVLKELTLKIDYWNNSEKTDLFVSTMIDDLYKFLRREI